MSSDGYDISEPELTADDILVLDDPRFTSESVAVVTGAASGIGRATAIALAANDLTVVGVDIDEAGLTETADLAEEVGVGGEILAAPTDLTDAEDVESAVEAAANEGDLRYVANIAGMQHIASIPNFPTETYDLMADLMLRAPFLTAKFAQNGRAHV